MKAFRRFLLLGTFAAAGIAVAICVAYRGEIDAKSSAVDTAVCEGGCALKCPAPVPTIPEVPAAKEKETSRPVVVLPNPLVANKYSPEPPEPAELIQPVAMAANGTPGNPLDYLRQQLSAAEAVPAPASPTPGPPAPSAARPMIGNQPTMSAPAQSPNGRASGRPSPGRNDSVPSNPPVVKADPEGDGKLTIHIQNSDLREVLDLMSEQGGLNILASKEVQGKVSASLSGVDINTALDAILKSTGYACHRQGKFIYVGTPDEFTALEQTLDRIGTRIYRPNYVPAAELKALIQPLITDKFGMVSVSSASEAGIAASDTTAGGDKYAGGDVVLVRDYEAVLAQIDQVVAEVDVRPMQVAIEAMILQADLDDHNKLGVDFALLQDHLKLGWGAPPGSLNDFKFDGGLKVGYLDSNVGVFLQALESIADTNVVGKPHLMVLNKHRAEILIGRKDGYISTTVTQTASTQSVDFLESGIQLRLRPFISRDGLIRMEVHPELSNGVVNVQGNFTLPNKTVTEVTTNVMVHDGCTVVIGGLIKDQKENTTTAVPVLGSLPWVGAAFRNTSEESKRTELIVLLTPHIVYEPGSCQEGSQAACEYLRRHDVYTEKMSPLGKRHIARRYIRLAQGALAQGDGRTALRFAEMAVHFDPENRDAIELRAQIWQSEHGGVPDTAMPATPDMALVDGPEIAPWVLDDLKRPAVAPESALLHPHDPGQPGLHRDILRPKVLP